MESVAMIGEERRIEGDGTPLETWLDWPELATLPTFDLEARIAKGRRVVVVAPHPDDEVLGCGALLQQCHALGRELLMISVTDGTGSHPDSTRWPPERLAATRPEESQRALVCLGLDDIETIRLRLPDTQVATETAELAFRLHKVLRDDDVIVTTWRGDGHADHEAVGEVCAKLLKESQRTLLEMPIWMWHWATPDDPRVPWHRAYRLPSTATEIERKQRAMREHVSQCEPDPTTGRPPILSAQALARLMQDHEVLLV
ncbi:PIG-L deacetylase family protein [Salinicola halophyticus]|uniref:PIG-L deacetylase family protein n=1 Tax=Salinicola halophyticus TaxID=1808881 RepID=UPI000DA1E03B|nr:PIG-L family deacetylase [Salinicola halophyticus]